MRRFLPVLVACFVAAPVLAETAEQPAMEQTTVEDAPRDETTEETGPQPTAAPAARDLMSLLSNSTEDQRARMLRFIRNRYPELTTDLLALLQTRQPGIFIALDQELQGLIASRYPRMIVEVQKALQQAINERYPQVRNQIAELIVRDYPELLEAMGESGAGDPATHTARLIRERHRALLDDVLALLREQHPTLLQEVQREVLVKHPELVIDVAALIVERYPDLSSEVTQVLVERYPELIPGMLSILAPPPAAEKAPADE